MSEQQREPQVGDAVYIKSHDSYNKQTGEIVWTELPPPWLPEDQWGYEYWVVFNMGQYYLTVPFYKREVWPIETKEEL